MFKILKKIPRCKIYFIHLHYKKTIIKFFNMNRNRRGANIYELFFLVFFILKITNCEPMKSWSWFIIISPLIIYEVVKYAQKFILFTGIKIDFFSFLITMYLYRKKRIAERKFRKKNNIKV